MTSMVKDFDMATRLELLENKETDIRTKALVLHELFCKSVSGEFDNGCPGSCDRCLEVIMKALQEDVGEDFGK